MNGPTIDESRALVERFVRVASERRTSDYPSAASVRRLNRLPTIDQLRSSVEERIEKERRTGCKHTYTALETFFKEEAGYPAGLALSMMKTVIPPRKAKSLLKDRWNYLSRRDDKGSVALRCFLVWRLGDTIGSNVRDASELYRFIVEHRRSFDLQHSGYWDHDPVSAILGGIFGHGGKITHPWSKRWMYLCCLPGVIRYSMSLDYSKLIKRDLKRDDIRQWRRATVLVLRLAINQKVNRRSPKFDSFVARVAKDTLQLIESY